MDPFTILPLLWTSEAMFEGFLRTALPQGDSLSVAVITATKDRTIGRIPIATARSMRPLIESIAASGIALEGRGDIRLRVWEGRAMRTSVVLSAVLAHGGPSSDLEAPDPPPVPRETPYCPRCALAEVTEARLRERVVEEEKRREMAEGLLTTFKSAQARKDASHALENERLHRRVEQLEQAMKDAHVRVPPDPAQRPAGRR